MQEGESAVGAVIKNETMAISSQHVPSTGNTGGYGHGRMESWETFRAT